MKTMNPLAALPVALLLSAFAPSSRPAGFPPPAPVSQKTAAGLSQHFRNDIAPLKATQVEAMNLAAFNAWLDKTTFTGVQKKQIRQTLQPVLKSGKFEALFAKKATPVKGKTPVDLVVVRVPKAVQQALNGSRFVSIILASGPNDTPSAPVIESCQYNYCYCSGSSNGLCVSATQFGKNCPPSECPVPQTACDCKGGGSLGLEQAFETVFG